MGPGQLYQDLQNLLHDLNVVSQITQLIGTLKGNYQVRVVAVQLKIPSLFLTHCQHVLLCPRSPGGEHSSDGVFSPLSG